VSDANESVADFSTNLLQSFARVADATRSVRSGMPVPAERDALYSLYSTQRSEGLPPAINDLYPQYLKSWHYLGTAGSCPNGGPGISYRPFDYESDNCVALERFIRWGVPQVPVPTALYRLLDDHGTLLYVGITDSPERRWVQHAGEKYWWPSVADRSIRWFPSREQALIAEAAAIRAERPIHNVQHNDAAA
jgi:predicted GIY-YIG superfamily endonuclease